MNDDSQHFEISKHKDYLYVIKENISLVHPVYTNDPLNMYLLLGSHTALLLDTGCGLSPLKPLVDELIGKKKLLVFNTHYQLHSHEYKPLQILHYPEDDPSDNEY